MKTELTQVLMVSRRQGLSPLVKESNNGDSRPLKILRPMFNQAINDLSDLNLVKIIAVVPRTEATARKLTESEDARRSEVPGVGVWITDGVNVNLERSPLDTEGNQQGGDGLVDGSRKIAILFGDGGDEGSTIMITYTQAGPVSLDSPSLGWRPGPLDNLVIEVGGGSPG